MYQHSTFLQHQKRKSQLCITNSDKNFTVTLLCSVNYINKLCVRRMASLQPTRRRKKCKNYNFYNSAHTETSWTSYKQVIYGQFMSPTHWVKVFKVDCKF